MNILYALTISFLAGMSTLLGSLFVFFKINKNNINKILSLFLSLAITIMIGISTTEIIPKSIVYISHHISYWYIYVPILFFCSYLFIILINRSLKHFDNDLYKIGVLSMITLAIHNFPEGIITFMTSTINESLGIKLGFSVALHNIPEGIIIAMPIYYSTKSRMKAVGMTILSGLAEPLGAIIAYLFLHHFFTDKILYIVLLFVGFIMIIISINELLPQVQKYNEKKYALFGVLIGCLFLMASMLI